MNATSKFTYIDEKLHGQREQAAVARAGGRAITTAVNAFFADVDSGRLGTHLADIISSNDSPRHEVVGLGSPESVAHVWARCIDPAAGGWEWYARRLAHVGDLSGYGPGDPTQTNVKLTDAEDMFGWAIYRVAMGVTYEQAVQAVRDEYDDMQAMAEQDFGPVILHGDV